MQASSQSTDYSVRHSIIHVCFFDSPGLLVQYYRRISAITLTTEALPFSHTEVNILSKRDHGSSTVLH